MFVNLDPLYKNISRSQSASVTYSIVNFMVVGHSAVVVVFEPSKFFKIIFKFSASSK